LTFAQIVALFYGLPLAVLGLGIRRSLGAKGIAAVLGSALVVGVYGTLLECGLHWTGHGLAVPRAGSSGELALMYFALRRVLPIYLGGALLGALTGALMRHRGEGSLRE
jgi:hypothetical protein